MPIPGDVMKNMVFRGGNLIKRGLSDAIFGIKAKAGAEKLTNDEVLQFSNYMGNVGNWGFGMSEPNVLKNNKFLDQNNLEAFYIATGKTVNEGDELSASGLSAIMSRYFTRKLGAKKYDKNSLAIGGESDNDGFFNVQRTAIAKDLRDVAAATAAGIVGLKVTQAGVSLLTGD